MDIFGGISIIMIARVSIMLTRRLMEGNNIDYIMKRHGKGELINNMGFKINSIIVWCYDMIKGKVPMNARARSLWYYMWNPHTPRNDTTNWPIHCIHRLMKNKK